MESVDLERETLETNGLRLVSDNRSPRQFPKIEKQFVNFMFLRVNSDWRKLDAETKRAFKTEFRDAFDEFGKSLLLFSYSLVGFDSKADLMFWRIGESLDLIQEMTAKLYRTNLGSYLETADNYLSFTKKRMFIATNENNREDRFHIVAGAKKYHFLYPCRKNRDWYDKSEEERHALIEENFMVGKKFENIKIHLTHAVGFSDEEFIVSFETDEPKDFLALAEELRETTASRFMLRGMPVYTCRQRSLSDCLDALG